MTTTTKDPVVVVLQMTGANDYLNTIIPYTNGHYHDARPKVGIPADKVIPINDELGFNPQMGRIKQLWDEGKVAIIHGIGYENSPRSHFRSMDIWHTCEPDIVGTEGWAGRVIRDLDPRGENVLKGVNFGQGLPRALALRGVPITSVSSVESYGVLSSVPVEVERDQLLDRFARMYSPTVGTGAVMDYLGQTGQRCPQGRGHHPERAGTVFLHRRVRRHSDCQVPAGHCPGLPGRPRHAALLHPARQLRLPLQPAADAHQAVDRHVQRDQRLLRRPGRARCR